MSSGAGLDIFLCGGKGKAEGLGLGLHEISVGIRGGASEAVVEVGDVEVDSKFGREAVKGVKEGEGVGAAGDADNQGAGDTGQVVKKDELADAGLEGGNGPPVR